MSHLFEGLNQSAQTIYQNNKQKGFWEKERNVGELLMLVTSELGEAMEAHRKGRFANLQEAENVIADGGFFVATFEKHIKDTFEDELADAIIRLLDMAAGLGIDIEKHLRAKIEYNKSRPKYHGKNY